MELKNIRNIGIIAHIDAGKTTVSERILFYTGVNYKIGEVHEGEATMDWMEQEQERGITITSAATTCFWTARGDNYPQCQINIIDTPGHVDFTAEVERSLRVLDGGVVVFDGVAGVEPQSETVWRQADKYNVPRVCFINKLDRMGASFKNSYQSILDRLTDKASPTQIPIGLEAEFKGIIDLVMQRAYIYKDELGKEIEEMEIPENMKQETKDWRDILVERVAEGDDALMEKFLEGKEVGVDELRAAIRRSVIANNFVPVLCGSALKNKGVQLLLDAVCRYLPSPLDVPPVKGINPKTDTEESRNASENEPLSALAFKIATDPFVGKLTFVRVYSGKLLSGSYVYNISSDEKERIGRLLQMHANHRKEIKEITAGNIGAVIGLKATRTGNTLCDESKPILLESIDFPEPVISIAIEPKTKADQEKMGMALQKLAEEDPTFVVRGDEETNQTIISGMGELHLDIIVDRMKREFKVEANVGQPQVAYRETIQKVVEAEGKFIRQSGGRGQYGHVWLKIEPQPAGEGFVFSNEIKGGAVPHEYIRPVEQGIKEAMQNGVLAGYPMVDIKATLYDGSYHEVDSSEMAFKIAGSMALQEGARKASLCLLEPIMSVEVVTPENYMGDVMGDLQSKRGQIQEMGNRGTAKTVKAFVPLATMFGYATDLRSMSQGRAAYTMEFDHYEKVPNSVAEEVISRRTTTKGSAK